MLRIGEIGFLGMHAEERRVEQLGVLEDGACLDEIGRMADLRAEAVLEFGVFEARDGPTPPQRFRQNSRRFAAPGKLPAMPTMAMAPSGAS